MTMTDFVQPTAIQPTTHPELLALPSDSNALQLLGAGPFPVKVQVDANGNAQFSSPTGTRTFPKIQWTFAQGQTTPVKFTFTFVACTNSTNTPIGLCTEALDDLAFGCATPLLPATPTQQKGQCQPDPGSYSFRVHYKTASGQVDSTGDPIIIVTPP
jgi:hypothetical protein